MTHGNKRDFFKILISTLFFAQLVNSQLYPEINTIISNELYQLTGSGDTLWVLSSKGVNYHLNIADSTMDWKGFKDLKGWFITYGSGYTLVRIMENGESFYKTGIPDRMWLFSITAPKHPKYIELPFDTDNLNTEAYFQASNALFFQKSFWLSCMNGGLVKYNIANGNRSIFFPGIQSIGFNEQEFVKAFPADSSNLYSDSTFVFDIIKDSSFLWIACKTALWTFNPKDTTWEKIDDSLLRNRHEYINIKIHKKNDTTYIYASLSELIGNKTIKSLFKYNTLSKKWIRSTSKDSLNIDIVFGKEDYAYMIDYQADNVKLFNDTTETIDLTQPYLDFETFENRIDKANVDILNFSKTDIHYAINGSDTIFAIATDHGLFYSINEHYDERNNIPFKYIGRSVPLKSDLKRIYAVPGIINIKNDTPIEAVFAYNLSKDDRVTIDIFDYNMDHVIRIIDNELRQAGKHRISGRSTIPSVDRWDGSKNGRAVAPGVYYFRIKPKKGNAKFGKIIVARN